MASTGAGAPTGRLRATPAAHEAIAQLRDRLGGAVVFVQSAGCCAGSVPMCYPEADFLIGPVDRLVGEVDGCSFYIDTRLDDAWGRPEFTLDVADGYAEGLSLAAGPGRRFVSHTGEATPGPG